MNFRFSLKILKTLSLLLGQSLNMASAGKSSDYGGIENYEKMSSQGAFYALNFFLNNEEIMNKVGLTTGMQRKTFIIQVNEHYIITLLNSLGFCRFISRF